MKIESKISVKVAKIISVAGHPFVLLSVTALLAALQRETAGRALSIAAITVAATVFPLLLIIRRQVAAGKWGDHDVSDAAERRSFYPVVMSVLAVALIIFYLLGFPRSLLTGMLLSLLLLATAMLINRRSKISLHLIFAAYFAVALLAVSVWHGAFFLLLAGAVGWSRVRLGRHTTAQVISGAALGALAGAVLLKLSDFF